VGGLENRCQIGPVVAKTRLSELHEGVSRANAQRVIVQITPIDAASRETVERTLDRATRALGATKARGLAEIVDWDVEEDRYWVAFAHSGATLTSALERGLSREMIVEIGTDISWALRALRQNGLVHRSINPDVVFVTPEGRASLLGLEGVRAIGSPDVLRDGVTVNDPRYTPPEAVDHESDDIRSDVYSLGCVLFRAVGGKPPYSANDEQQIHKLHRAAQIPSVPGEPSTSGWNALFAKMLAKRPDDRPYPEELEPLLRPLRYAGMKLTDKSALKPSKKQRSVPVFAIVTVLVGALVLGGAMFALRSGTDVASLAESAATVKPSAGDATAAASAAPASAAASAAASASPSATAVATAAQTTTARPPVSTPRPATPAPTVAPTVAPDFVSPVVGPPGTPFVFTFTGLPPSETYRTSYTRGGVTTNYVTGEVTSSGTALVVLRTQGAQFPPDSYVFTIRAAGIIKNINFRIAPPS